MSSAGAARRAAVSVSNACAPLSPTLVVASLALNADVVSARSAKASQARASRKNGAKPRGPKAPEGKACTSVGEMDQ